MAVNLKANGAVLPSAVNNVHFYLTKIYYNALVNADMKGRTRISINNEWKLIKNTTAVI